MKASSVHPRCTMDTGLFADSTPADTEREIHQASLGWPVAVLQADARPERPVAESGRIPLLL
jgi:hypothetical protein